MMMIRFHAYFPAGNSYPSILADMLSDAIGCVGFSWVSSSSTSLSVTYSILTFVKTWLLIIIRQKTSLVLSFKQLIIIIPAIALSLMHHHYHCHHHLCHHHFHHHHHHHCDLTIHQAAGPACTELETIVLDWLGTMIGQYLMTNDQWNHEPWSKGFYG